MNSFLQGYKYRVVLLATEREIDRLLVERVQCGDKKSFDILVLKYQRKLLRLVLRFVHNQAEAEDIVQDTFIKAYRALPQFRGDAAFYTWLYRIGINTVRNFLEDRGRKETVSKDVEKENGNSYHDEENSRNIDTPESILASKQIAETVNLAVGNLPDELRLALELREMEGLSYEEIAMIMNCPIGTVRSRIFRAREVVAHKLKPLLGTNEKRRFY